jgi:putative membrane protein
MKPTLHSLLVTVFNLFYLLAFTIYFIAIQNYEFLFYILILAVLITATAVLHRRIGLSYPLLWALSLWGLMHMCGGGLYIGETKLYDLVLISLWTTPDFTIFKFDQFVHLYLYFVVSFLIYELVQPYLSTLPNALLYPLIAMAGTGIGALNEIAEFTTVLLFHDTGVGNYHNNAWDLVFNTAGAIAGVLTLHCTRRRS